MLEIRKSSIKRSREQSSMIFNVLVTETLSKVVQIEAQEEDEAIAQAEEKYLKGEIVLDAEDDFNEANYVVVP
jgi:hypothetical protein